MINLNTPKLILIPPYTMNQKEKILKKPSLSSVTVKCPAKINLYLNTLRKNSNGFHEIESIFHTVGIYDYITIKKSRKFSLIFSKKSTLPIKTENYDLTEKNFLETLFYQLKEKYKLPNLTIEIEKHIPIRAGLGGGSSDTAGFLVGLNRLLSLNIPLSEQLKITAALGSDTPFFLKGGMAFVSGRGEVIEPAKFTLNNPLVVIYPDIHISTALAYQKNNTLEKDILDNTIKKRLDYSKFKAKLIKLNLKKDLNLSTRENLIANRKQAHQLLSKKYYNSFQEKTEKNYPIIGHNIERLKEFKQPTLLSGSGSSLFTICHDKILARKIYQSFKKDYPFSFNTHLTHKGVSII